MPYFAASATDRFLAVLTRRPASRRFVFVLEFDRPLDGDRLGRAWEETRRRHPILAAARWAPSAPPGWVPGEPGQRGDDSVGVLDTHDSGGRTVLRVSLDHGAVDVGGALNCLQTLRDRYVFQSATRRADLSPRTFCGVAAATGLSSVVAGHAVRTALARWAQLLPSGHTMVQQAERASGPETLRLRLDAAGTAALRAAARAAGTRMAARLAAGLALAWERAAGASGGSRDSGWLLTFDLRPTLGTATGVGNLSGIDAVSFAVAPGNPALTLAAAAASFARLEGAYPGLASQVLAERWGRAFDLPGADLAAGAGVGALRRATRFERVLSNLGSLPPGIAAWDDATVTDVFVIPPFAGSRQVVFSISAFAGELSVVIRRHGERLPDGFFDCFAAEAPAALEAVAGSTR